MSTDAPQSVLSEFSVTVGDSTDSPVDVVVTTQGGLSTARAVQDGGGIVGVRSSATAPAVSIGFVDWPYDENSPSIESHIAQVREHRPKYAVAPDVDGRYSLDRVVEIADSLARYADHVIVVPKTVPVSAIPRRFVVGLPFRDEFDTDTGVNSFGDYRGRPVHILGGNPTEQFKLAESHGLSVTSVDSPDPLAWADYGRVWIGRLGAGDEVHTIDPSEIDLEAATACGFSTIGVLAKSRFYRVRFTVRNLISAWENDRTLSLPRAVEPGRGPPPPAPEGLGDPDTRDKELARFMEATERIVLGSVESDTSLDLF